MGFVLAYSYWMLSEGRGYREEKCIPVVLPLVKYCMSFIESGSTGVRSKTLNVMILDLFFLKFYNFLLITAIYEDDFVKFLKFLQCSFSQKVLLFVV